MSNYGVVEAMTNLKKDSCVVVKYDCETMWSMVQELPMLRMANITSQPGHDVRAQFISDYNVRARRIAATYARFYLELEQGCVPEKKGRFYWMALGAFASKTVACAFELWQIKGMTAARIKTTKQGLGKGNLWLFQDIAGWHWYYSKYGNSFDMCVSKRDASIYSPAARRALRQLDWCADALPKIKHMRVSNEIRKGFELVKQIENTKGKERRAPLQLDHLLAIANHEQGVILQPLIYDDPDFAYWIKLQRSVWVNWASPDLKLVFSHACDTSKPELQSTAPEDTKLEEFDSRMKWITAAADKFHRLMQFQTDYMEGELRTMAGWVDMQDKA